MTDDNLDELRAVASAYSAYERATLDLAKGDRIRTTRGGYTQDRKHRVENGSIYTVKDVADNGEITLTNGWKIANSFGHFTHGYVTTSIGAQGRNADHVLIAQSADSYAASNTKQLYVSISRGKESAQIYCDDKVSLKRAIQRTDQELTGHSSVRILKTSSKSSQIGRSPNRKESKGISSISRSTDSAASASTRINSLTSPEDRNFWRDHQDAFWMNHRMLG